MRRWSEVPSEDDYLRWARGITVIATLLFGLVLVGIVVALVLR